MGKRFMLVTEEGNYLFVHKVEPENTQKKKSHTANSKLFVKSFCTFVAKYLKENKDDSLCLALKYARIFFLWRCLFLEALGKLSASWNRSCMRTNIRAYLRAKQRLLLIYRTLKCCYTILPTSHCSFKFFCMFIRHDFHERSHICEPVS